MEKNHITFIFEAELYDRIKDLTSNIILIDNSEAAANIAKHDTDVFHISAYQECPSIIYNAMLTLNAIPEVQKKGTKQSSQMNLKVLVAEDYDINRILIEEMLAKYSITPDFALDGAEAVEMALREHYDLILMDINMPNMNGIDATIKLRELGITTPIVALTANALEGDAERFMAVGMDDYISKPIDWDKLNSVLTHYNKQLNEQTKMTEDESSQDKGQEEKIPKTEKVHTDLIDPIIEKTVTSLLETQSKLHFPLQVIEKLFRKFVDTSLESLAQMKTAVESNDLQTIQERAHAIRGIALSLQLNEISELCDTLEYGAKDKEAIDYHSLVDQLSDRLMALQNHCEAIIRQLHTHAS